MIKDNEMICQSCNQQMKLVLKKKYKNFHGEKRIRKFHCELCNLSETIYGTGNRDVEQNPLKITNENRN